ncbi:MULTISPECIES: hypothetical protein [Mycobacteroides]|uniref:hypothetical protein n=1 Tax=Mycobacteroides TaxID=670516 RepID=UPI0008A89222|nr:MULTISPECIES: hypothetical protein [Mycobacteroides]AYM40384.1 hypothetical protein DYE20_01420 [[Mycobacterium] chelonae subsp. gwanakae]OHU15970.1 hypothetical protein BKG75_13075 [Mycobacteroides chelonae]SIF23971.1 Uncharacterised protein [Mycobacteroides abscessus subsp. abscessus]SIF37839.1 Uncharacterised protein [Mycobacteroides abscessus subsp. abscessus]SIF85015.1 Uncharacterised protein [Mycobacteroides abscessus subsp. abscessus]
MSAPTTTVTIQLPTGRPLRVRTVADLRPLLRGKVPPDAVITKVDISATDILCHVALPEQLSLLPVAS